MRSSAILEGEAPRRRGAFLHDPLGAAPSCSGVSSRLRASPSASVSELPVARVAAGRGGTLLTGRRRMVATGRGGSVLTGRGGNVAAGRGATVATGRGGGVATGRGATVPAGRGGRVAAGRGATVAAGRGGSGAAGCGATVATGRDGCDWWFRDGHGSKRCVRYRLIYRRRRRNASRQCDGRLAFTLASFLISVCQPGKQKGGRASYHPARSTQRCHETVIPGMMPCQRLPRQPLAFPGLQTLTTTPKFPQRRLLCAIMMVGAPYAR
jgi:hypothetical protein